MGLVIARGHCFGAREWSGETGDDHFDSSAQRSHTGIVSGVMNALMLWLSSSPVRGDRVEGFGAALAGSVFLCVLNLLVVMVSGPIV